MTEQNNTNGNQEIQFPEAPASWNTRYVHPLGFECQITLRAERGLDLMEKVEAATAFLLKNGCEPYLYRLSGSRKELEEEHADDPAWISRQTAWLGEFLDIKGHSNERHRIWPIVQLSDWGETVPVEQVRVKLSRRSKSHWLKLTLLAGNKVAIAAH